MPPRKIVALLSLLFPLIPLAPTSASAETAAPSTSAVQAAPTSESAGNTTSPSADQLPETCYLFSYFTQNGQDGLHLAWSVDGYQWQEIPGGPLLKPVLEDCILRDPCLQQGPDGTFHLVWTTSWTKGGFGHASSKDLITWTEQQYVPAMAHEPLVQNTWAPELAYDHSKNEWLILWSSTITGRFHETDPVLAEGGAKKVWNHRLYATTTRDWTSFTPTKLFYDDDYSIIDATLVPVEDRFAMVVKDERIQPTPQKNLRIAWARTLQGPYGTSAPTFSKALIPSWLEGPTLVKIGEKWFLYADAYRDKHYVLLTSTDLASWTDETASLRYPKGLRHGTSFAVKREVLQALLARK